MIRKDCFLQSFLYKDIGVVMGIGILLNDHRIADVCSVLEDNSYKAFLVGGCVRDALMGKSSLDIDITTTALPEQVVKCFSDRGYKVIKTGIAHGTVMIIADNRTFEITTMRREGNYDDMRHPSCVCYVDDIKEDLGRRDFTVNSIAYSLSENKIIDIFGGVSDIENRTLRCVGDPESRFCEDALRIIRALRFSSALGFSIEDRTSLALRSCKNNLNCISFERIKRELDKLILGDGAGNVLYKYADVISVIIPEILDCRGFEQNSKYHIYDVLEHICKVIDYSPKTLSVRYAALFHDIGKPPTYFRDESGEGHFYGHAARSAQIAESSMQRLKFDKNTAQRVYLLVKHHDTPLPDEIHLIKRRLNKFGESLFFELISLSEADCKAQSSVVKHRLSFYEELRVKTQKIIDERECINVADLSINGYDLIELGYSGRQIGDTLQYLLDSVICGRLNNIRDELINEATLKVRQFYDL